ncbi:CCA tRNA nucleotidyltransferase [Paenibacillus filicis]|uniref:CCA tRNA nucleotidyltransferase n=1 Tax=Paenibacillus filicis TaxID=669464 RepID=A0ABU9DF04_9BACL
MLNNDDAKKESGQVTPLRDSALQIIARLAAAGYEAYLVGGCVRDQWLSRAVKDYDIATSALPERVEELFERTVPTGLQHGTVTVVMDRQPFEVTTFRRESDYADFRRPEAVEYILELDEDLRRRDFTMNAMAMDGVGRIIDPFGGRADLERGLLRCVGSASERFSEDALRMLRCIRFAAEYGLEIEKESWSSLIQSAPLLTHIAMERVRAELERMLTGSDPNRALRLLEQSGLLSHTKAPLLWRSLPASVSDWPDLRMLPEAGLRIAYVYGCLKASPADCAEDMRRLTFSGQQIGAVSALLNARVQLAEAVIGCGGAGKAVGGLNASKSRMASVTPSHEAEASEDGAERFQEGKSSLEGQAAERTAWILAAVQYGKDTLRSLLQLYRLDPAWVSRGTGSSNHRLADAIQVWLDNGENWLADMPVAMLSELHLTGQDVLQRLRLRGGPWTGKLLLSLLRQTALGLLPNEKEALLLAAEGQYDEYRETEKR